MFKNTGSMFEKGHLDQKEKTAASVASNIQERRLQRSKMKLMEKSPHI